MLFEGHFFSPTAKQSCNVWHLGEGVPICYEAKPTWHSVGYPWLHKFSAEALKIGKFKALLEQGNEVLSKEHGVLQYFIHRKKQNHCGSNTRKLNSADRDGGIRH